MRKLFRMLMRKVRSYLDSPALELFQTVGDDIKMTLGEEIEVLETDIPELHSTLNETTELRLQEKEENLERIKTGKEGVKAVTEAIVLLKTYYKHSSMLLQASPVDEDTEGPGFSGDYKGKGDGAKGIIGLLEVIKSDFDRAATLAEKAEEEAEQEWLAMQTDMGKSNVTKRETLKSVEGQLSEAAADNEDARESLVGQQDLLDKALGQLEALGPPCLGPSGPTAEEIKIKRDQEIEALNQALCILDQHGGGGVELC